jgi:quinol-cytochrome oxidoreductase complex cytochrome b subunit
MTQDGWSHDPEPPPRRRPLRSGITILVIVSFLTLTLMSTCAPRRTVVRPTTTTTIGIQAAGA